MLTAGADTGAAFTGTEKGDVFNAYEFISITGSKLDTLNGIDSLDGGAGRDELNVKSGSAISAVNATISNIETINLESAAAIGTGAGGAFDTTTFTGAETLNVTKATAATLTAAATTDVNVSGITANDGDISVKGGKNIVVTDAKAGGNITIGDNTVVAGDATGTITITDTNNAKNGGANNDILVSGGTDVTVTTTADKASSGAITIGHATNGMATGNVVVTQNTTHNATTASITAGDVTVTGGKTVEITANMTNTAVKAGASANIITAGKYTVTAGNTTTDVTITQNATATDFANDAAGMVKETSVVTFNNMKINEVLTINGLTFTASKNLTASEVAAAFANLTAADTQSATGITANGIFTGTFNTAVWTSAAANGATVTFTAIDENETDLAFTGNATTNDAGARIPTQTKVAGTAAATSTAVDVTEDFGDVVVDDNVTKSITTITLDGFNKATLGATVAASSLDKLATLNLANNTGAIALTSTVATLNVTLDDINGTVDLDGAAATTLKTLNLTTTGEASNISLSAVGVETLTIAAAADLDIATGSTLTAVKTVTVSGTADVTLGNISGATTTALTSTTTGDVSAQVDGTKATVTTGSGNDTITLSNAAAISKAINLGAGDDTLILAAGTTAIPTVAVNGGAGTDTISMTTISAESYDANTNFASAISGFERLTISNATNAVIEAKNLGFNYVTFGGAATGTLNDVAANSTTVLEAAGNSLAIVLDDATGEADVANVVVNNKAVNTAVYTFDLTGAASTAIGQTLTVGGVLLYTSAGAVAAPTFATTVAGAIDTQNITIGGVEYVINATDPTAVKLTAQSDVTISETSLTIGGTATAPAVATATTTAFDVDFGTVTINDVETINLTSSDATTSVVSVVDKNTLNVSADKAKTINIDGNADLTLTTTTAPDLKTVDASDMTGALTFTAINASMTVKGGAGNDVITIKETADGSKFYGNAGNDTFIIDAAAATTVGADLITIDGGAGADTFVFKDVSTNKSNFVVLNNVDSGDTIDLFAFTATTFNSTKITLSVGATESTQAYLDQAMTVLSAGQVGWFQYNGNTYVTADVGADSTNSFVDGQDFVVMITGLKDLSAGASFNATDGTLEIA